jgi:hypothetical protein
MHRSRIHDEVVPGPWVAHEELDREQLALEAIAARTRGNEVAKGVRATVSEWIHMIERGVREFEGLGAVDTAATAVAHGGAFNRVLVVGCRQAAGTTGMGGSA